MAQATEATAVTDEGQLAPGPAGRPRLRLSVLLRHLGWPPSAWYRIPLIGPRRAPGPKPKDWAPDVIEIIELAAREQPWWGYKRIATMLRMLGIVAATNKLVYRIFKLRNLLQRRRPKAAELHQATKLYELLPKQPNELWQADVTYINIPGHGWWYAVTVIDYYSRYLLACHLTASFSAEEVAHGLDQARAEAKRMCGPLTKPPTLVTDNGVSFMAVTENSYIG